MPSVQPIVIESDIEADRRRLWIEVYLLHKEKGHPGQYPDDVADAALAQFDKRFPSQSPEEQD